jgi:hypothetical protein
VTAPTTAPPQPHESFHGFCTVCGSVWPCSRATKTTREPVPVPRMEVTR